MASSAEPENQSRSGLLQVLGDAYEPFLHGAATMLVFWLILYWMYRRKLFLRI